MINLSKSGSTVTFTFDENSGYLQNGTIEVPVNSLSLVIDDSDMATFKKSASNDIFISARYEEFGKTKAELESWYKDNMVGSTGGGVDSGTVQTMIDESISGKADTSAVTVEISAAVSGKADIGDIPDVSNYFDNAAYDSGTTRINFYHNNTIKAYIDASDFVIDGMVESVTITSVTSGQSETQLTWNNNYAELPSGCTSIKADTENYAFYYIYFKDSSDATLREIMITKSGDEITVHTTAFTDCEYSISGTNVYISWSSSIGIAKLYVTGAEKLSLYATMPNEVEVLQITWNSAAGGQVTNIPLSDIFDPSNYYTKTEVDASLSGKADTTAVTEAISAATDDMATQTWVGEQGFLTEHQSLSAYSTTQEVNTAIEEATSGKADTSAVTDVNNVLTAHTADTTIHVTSADKTAWNAKSDFSGSYNDLTDKPTIPTVPTNVSAFNNDAGYATSGYVDSEVSGKVDTSSVTTSVTSASTDSEIPTAKAVYDAVGQGGGGGKAVAAGTNISVTTGETADTVSCTLSGGTLINIANNKINCQAPIRYGTGISSVIVGVANSTNKASGTNSIAIGGDGNTASGQYSHAEGCYTTAATQSSHSEGWYTKANGQHSHSEGKYTVTNNVSEHASGQYNVSSSASTTWGDSGNTLFSVGNGTADNARHNAFEIRQNGDIYCSDGTNDVKLQDTITATAANTTALGGLSLVKLTQAQYDALATKDNSTLYVVTDS